MCLGPTLKTEAVWSYSEDRGGGSVLSARPSPTGRTLGLSHRTEGVLGLARKTEARAPGRGLASRGRAGTVSTGSVLRARPRRLGLKTKTEDAPGPVAKTEGASRGARSCAQDRATTPVP